MQLPPEKLLRQRSYNEETDASRHHDESAKVPLKPYDHRANMLPRILINSTTTKPEKANQIQQQLKPEKANQIQQQLPPEKVLRQIGKEAESSRRHDGSAKVPPKPYDHHDNMLPRNLREAQKQSLKIPRDTSFSDC